jgi:hypothetical protein
MSNHRAFFLPKSFSVSSYCPRISRKFLANLWISVHILSTARVDDGAREIFSRKII